MFKFLIAVLLGFGLIVAGCAITPDDAPTEYTQERYPTSLIVKYMAENNRHPEKTAKKIWRIIELEIKVGALQRDDVLLFCQDKLEKIQYITYSSLFEALENLNVAKADNALITQAFVIGIFMLESDFEPLAKIDKILALDDLKLIRDLLEYIQAKTLEIKLE